MDTRGIEELARKLADSVPPGMRTLQADLEKNFRALLESGIARMNLVTREEFDVQQRVLERTREYGVLKALGTRPGFIFRLIMAEVLLLAALSAAAGALLSLALNKYLSVTGIPIPDPISYGGVKFTRMLSAVTADTLVRPALTVLAAALVVGIFPALKAARITPVKALGSR